MAFENFWKRDRERYSGERSPQRSRSEQNWRDENRVQDPERGYGAGSEGEGDYARRGWREGSDYYGNRDERYGRGESGPESSRRQFSAQGGYGERDYGRQSSRSGDWRDEGQSYDSQVGRPYGRSGFGQEFGDDESRGSFGTFGSGGYGSDRDSGRRGAYGYGGTSGAQQQFRGRGPRGYRRSDERIREDICETLTDDPYIDASNLEVTVKECEVTLGGTVSSREDKRRAEDLVERVSGVKDVHNTLRVAAEQRSTASTEAQGGGTTTNQTSRH